MQPQQIQEKLVSFAQPKHAADMPSRADLEYYSVATTIRNGETSKIVLKAFGLLGMQVDDDIRRFVDEEQAGYLAEVTDDVVDVEAVQKRLPDKAGINLIFRNFGLLFEKKGESEESAELHLPAPLKQARALSSYIVGKAVLIEEGERLPLKPAPDIAPAQSASGYFEDLAETA